MVELGQAARSRTELLALFGQVLQKLESGHKSGKAAAGILTHGVSPDGKEAGA
jgi:hypothetical protein